jgi:two-component system, sensor histidine kinase and response regulator
LRFIIMGIDETISKSLKDKERYDFAHSKLVMELIAYKANERDHEINNKLLNQLILKYSDAERKLNELNQLKNKFLGMAAHDLRNPLASIRGFSEILLTEAAGPLTDQQKEFLTIINTTSEEMLHIVNDLLDVSIIESGKVDLNLNLYSFRKLLEERIRLMQITAENKQMKINVDYDDVPEFKFDTNRISQVIDNLISNAIKFSPPGSTINVTLKRAGDMAEVAVRDKGPGISPEDRNKLFGTFQKLSARPTGGEKSTGLGLAIVKKIVNAHGGEVSVESELGSGSVFKFNIPMEAK